MTNYVLFQNEFIHFSHSMWWHAILRTITVFIGGCYGLLYFLGLFDVSASLYPYDVIARIVVLMVFLIDLVFYIWLLIDLRKINKRLRDDDLKLCYRDQFVGLVLIIFVIIIDYGLLYSKNYSDMANFFQSMLTIVLTCGIGIPGVIFQIAGIKAFHTWAEFYAGQNLTSLYATKMPKWTLMILLGAWGVIPGLIFLMYFNQVEGMIYAGMIFAGIGVILYIIGYFQMSYVIKKEFSKSRDSP